MKAKAGNVDIDISKEFTAEQLKKVDKIIDRFKDRPGALIPVLEEVQMALEFLPMPILKIIAKGLNQSGLRSGDVLFIFHHDPARQVYRPRMFGNRLLRPGWQGHL